MIREIIAKYLGIPDFIVRHREGIFVFGALMFAAGVWIQLKKFYEGEEIRLLDKDDLLIYLSIPFILLGLLLMF